MPVEHTFGIEWPGGDAGGTGTERPFLLRQPEGPVPGVLWSPRGEARPPLALLAHGGSGHKRTGRHVRMGRWLASAGVAAVAIDGPHHGDRVQAPLAAAVYQPLIAAEGITRFTARVTGEWLAAVAALAALGLADENRVSVFGMSMGARYGLPLAAALGPRLRCAVLGKFGLAEAPPVHPGLHAPTLTRAAARAVRAPVLFHVQWDDELFPRDGQFALFGVLGSPDKRLVARPGPHGGTHPGDEAAWAQFLARWQGASSATK
jgi:dienelactone hydrolase